MAMNTMLKRASALTLAVLMVTAVFAFLFTGESYAAKIRLSKKSLILGKGASYKLKVKGTKAKVKWSSTKKSVATVSKKGVVKARKTGKCYIKAKVAGRTLKCKVTVKKPAVANAMNLRLYVLKNGKKKGSGIYDLEKKWSVNDGVDKYTVKARAYKDKTEMLFIVSNDYDFGTDITKYWLTIDLIKQKPGDVYVGYFQSSGSEEYYYGTLGYDFDFEYGSPEKTAGAALTEYDYDEGDPDTPMETYTDPTFLDGQLYSFAYYNYASGIVPIDEFFKKAGLKYRMYKMGFTNMK